MKRVLFYIQLLAASCFLLSCGNHGNKNNPAETVTRIIEADNRADIETVLNLYSDDAILMPSGKPNIAGKVAIRKNYEEIFLGSSLQLYPVIEEVMQSNDLAVVRGTIRGIVTSKTTTTTTTVNDKFLMTLANGSDGWKIRRLIWSWNE
jgi:ketosteroid isomerase-like protein